jgi:hypothetical protein
MRLDDIDGSKPRIVRQLPHSRRMVNPVDPKYDLPSYDPPTIIRPRFIRDSLYNDDVEGAHPLSYQNDKPPRDIMNIDDIDGCRPVRQMRELKRVNDSLNVKDINNDGIHKTTRHCDPQNPVYVYDGMKNQPVDFGKVKPLPAAHKGPDRSKDISDIEGTHADASTKRFRAFRQQKITVDADEDLKPAPILMVPSMKKQTRELELQAAARNSRGEKIRFYENRSSRRHQTFE